MKYLRTVHEHNRPYHSLAIASTKRETITFEVCAVCIRQDSTPMVLLRWNQMKKSNIHILHLVILLSSMSPSPDKNMCLLCCCSARFWEMCFLASEPWKWRTKVTLTTRSWLKLYNSCQTNEDLCECGMTSSRMCELPFCCQVPRREGHEIRTLPPNCLYQQFLAVTRTESWSRQSFRSKSGSQKISLMSVRAYHSRNIQEYLEVFHSFDLPIGSSLETRERSVSSLLASTIDSTGPLQQ